MNKRTNTSIPTFGFAIGSGLVVSVTLVVAVLMDAVSGMQSFL